MAEGAPEVTNGPGGSQVRYRGRRLYSGRPIAGAEARAARLELAHEAIILLAAPLLGYGLQVLRERVPETSTIILVEADPALRALATAACGTEVADPSEMGARLRELPDGWFLRFRRISVVSLNAAYALSAPTYRNLASALRARLQRAWQNKMTTIHMGRMWITNVIANLPLVPGARDIAHLHTDKTVAVVGAGPSLDRTISALLANRQDLFVLSVDTAYRALLSHGVQPDLLCVVEAQHANLADVLGAPISEQPVCADIASYPGLLRRCSKDKLFVFSSGFADTSLLVRLEKAGVRPTPVQPLGSVGVTAIHLAGRIGNGRVLLFGLDFAFRHGKTHARGTPHHEADLRTRTRLSGSDPAPFTLSARTLRTRDAPLPLTTSELRTYNQVAADLCGGIDAYDLSEAPISMGSRISTDEIGDMAAAESPTQNTFAAETVGGKARSLVEEEIAELTRLIDVLRAGDWATARSMADALAYVTIDFPESLLDDPALAPRLLAACSFYRRRWRRALERLRVENV